MITFLKEKFFQLSKHEKFYAIIAISLFFSIFMIFFQPFGVNNYDPKESITAVFALIMISIGFYLGVLLIVNEFLIFPLFFKREIYRWQILIWLVWSNIYAATGLFLFYNLLGNWHDFRISSWLEFIFNFTALSFIPLTAIFFYSRMKQMQELTETKVDFQLEGKSIINIPSDNQNDINSYSLENILYLESEDNYVAIHFINKDILSKALIRSSLKKIDDLKLHPALIRCHRSFMINLVHLAQYDGNKQQGLITLKHIIEPIPVSKSYASDLLLRLK
ncbi:LytTR family DNA-binding domain-containing protein [Algoriphagus sp.]|uniref:LytR/AlgR family response regulator transcription factor n=1 Tax=Algoriphagus sp. TaxID=1872435 RepID=UPI0025E022E6|nr:LytTR family DNA-binding domain-containing protein [Algoriphagus sp.]